jgi:hypothetical protein
MATTVGKIEKVTGLFSGQGDLFVFDALSDLQYENATLANLSGAVSLGQIVQDSTSWEGEDPEVTELKDEQGNIITAKVAAGTLAWSFDLASTSSTMIKKFLKGVGVDAGALTGDSTPWTEEGMVVTGFGVEIPVVTLPMAIVNDALNKTWLYPKTKITSSLAYEDGLWRIHCACIAEFLDTAGLKTGMLIEAAVGY